MNKRKKVAWAKHRKRLKKVKERRRPRRRRNKVFAADRKTAANSS